jgi:hypothetical protein
VTSTPAPSREQATITSLELLAGGSVVVVAVVGWVALALAELGLWSLPAVLLVAAVVLAAAVIAVRRWAPVQLRSDRAGVLVAIGCAAVAAVMTFPGFAFGVADKDPGGYVSHAVEIARTGDYAFVDPLLAAKAHDPSFPVQEPPLEDARFPGVWIKDRSTGLIVPQFFHLWPALMAVSYDAGGVTGLRNTSPLMGVVATLLLCALLRRVGTVLAGPAAGLVAAGAGGLLLATNMLQVWQSRYPTTEVLSQALFLGTLLGIVISLQSRWWPAAAIAGLLVGVGFLNRADGLLLVLLSAGIGAALVATRRFTRSAAWFALGLAVVLPHAVLQAYWLCRRYTLDNHVPNLPTVAALLLGLLVVALVLRTAAARPLCWAQQRLELPRSQRVVGALVVAGAVGLMALGFLRPRLFGESYFDYNGRIVRSYDEQILHRLSWFFSLPGFALMLLGLAVVVLRRWRAELWVVLLPTLLLFPLYSYRAHNSTRMMWWGRRYVPTVLPGVVVLIALALAWATVTVFRGRPVLRLPAVAALSGLLAFFLHTSLPLRGHDEWHGSFDRTAQIVAVAGGRQGVFLWDWEGGRTASLFGTAVWLQHGQVSGLLPFTAQLSANPRAREQMLSRYAQQFPGQPMFLVTDKPVVPKGIDPARVVPVQRFTARFPLWQQSDVARPEKALILPVQVCIWRVRLS